MKTFTNRTSSNYRIWITVILILTSFSGFSQLLYLTTVPPYNGGNGSSMAAFNVKAKKAIRIKEMFCTFSTTSSQTTIIWYKTDSILGTPNVSSASGWIQACTYTHSPSISGIGTVALCSDTSLNILIPQGAVYAFAISGASITYTGTGSTSINPYLIEDSNMYINMGPSVGYGGTILSPIAYRQYNGKIGYQVVNLKTDAGLEGIQSPGDSVCSGTQPISVTLKNHGPNLMQDVKINWSINNVMQPVFNWTGNLAANTSTNVTIGDFPFLVGTTYNIKAYTHNPNNIPDTLNNLNDTIVKTGLYVKQSPGLTFSTPTLSICAGDTAHIGITLTGTAPWSLILDDGTNPIPITNITSSSYNVSMIPAASKTYTLISLSDATGCIYATPHTAVVDVHPAPPAMITPVGSTAACAGDSVTLMGTVGLNFTYKWYKDGTLIPGAVNYVMAAKQPGSYTVQVTSPIGCKALSAPVMVFIHPAPVVNLGNDTALLLNKNITLNAGAGFVSYLWSTGATSQQITIDSAGTGIGIKTVWVEVTDNNGCKGGDTIKINFTNNPGIATPSSPARLKIIPNPTNGMVEILLPPLSGSLVNIEVLGTDGKRVFSTIQEINEGQQILVLNLDHLADGQYILKIGTNTATYSDRLLIIK